MPIYEFYCDACDERFERIHSFDARPQSIPCPSCASRPARLIVSVPGAIYPPYPEYDGGEVWKDTPLDGMDGRNPVTHESDAPFVDLGDRQK